MITEHIDAVPTYSRRQALRLLLGTAAFFSVPFSPTMVFSRETEEYGFRDGLVVNKKNALILPTNILASHPVSELETGKAKLFWAKLGGFADELITSEDRSWSKPMVRKIKDQLTRLQVVYEPFTNTLSRLIDETYRQHKEMGNESLIGLYKNILGVMEHITPEGTIPFFAERNDIERYAAEIGEKLEGMVKKKREYKDANLNSEYYSLGYLLDAGIDYMALESNSKSKELCKEQIFVDIDPYIAVTPNGRIEFEKDKKLLFDELSSYRYYRNTCSDFILSSSRYGTYTGSPIITGAQGLFRSYKLVGSHLFFGEHIINMDKVPELGDHTQRYVIRHEGFGHGTDPSVNRSLLNLFTPAHGVECMTFMQQVLNNPNWAGNDSTVKELFQELPLHNNIGEFLDGQEKVDAKTFLGLISRYPRNRLLLPFFTLIFTPQEIKLQVVSLIDYMLGLPVPEDKILGEVSKLPKSDKSYDTLEQFANDYYPVLERDVREGNIRARYIKLALDKFKNEVSNFKFLADLKLSDGTRFIPHSDKGADTWTNYLRFTVSDALFYHNFLNGAVAGEDLRTFYDSGQRIAAEQVVFTLRGMYRFELYAEGVALSHSLGQRIGKNPYTDALAKVAYFLS